MSPLNLAEAIDALGPVAPLPLPLPAVHVTSVRAFREIVHNGALLPTPCKTFGENLLYLFYGGAFYRRPDRTTRNAAELPVVLVFDPRVLQSAVCYYPCDTGGLASGRFGGDWERRLHPFRERLRVDGRHDPSVPCRIVHHLFGSNESYLRGQVDPSCTTKPEPFATVCDLLTADLTPLGVDHRQCIIEIHMQAPLSLRENLLWVAFPEAAADAFAELYELTQPSMPDFYMYPSHAIFNPAHVTAQLQERASDIVARFVALPEA